MARLEALDRVHQRALVQIGIVGNRRVRRQIAQQAQQARQSPNAIVRTPRRNGFGRNRKLLAVVQPRQFQIVLQRCQSAPVTGKGRPDVREFSLLVLAINQPFTQESGQVVFLGFHTESKLEVSRVDLSDMTIGDVAHHANR